MVVVMCYNGFGIWVLTQILSVTLFTAQCMSTAERGNDQLWDVRHTSGRLVQTIFTVHLVLHTALSFYRTGFSHGLHTPGAVLIPFYLWRLNLWQLWHDGTRQNIVSSFLKCVSGLPANGPESNELILSGVGGCLVYSTPAQSITDTCAGTNWNMGNSI